MLATTSPHEVVRSQARGALWILEGKEQKTPTSASGVSTAAAGSPLRSFTTRSVSFFCPAELYDNAACLAGLQRKNFGNCGLCFYAL